MSFKGRYPNGQEFHSVIKAIATVLSDCVVNVSSEGLRVSRIDTESVVMVDLFLSKADFTDFSLRGKPEIEVGLSTVDLKRLLEWMTVDPLRIEIPDQGPLKLSQERSGLFEERVLFVPRIQVDTEREAAPPENEPTGTAEFSAKTMTRLIQTHMSLGNSCQIKMFKTKLQFQITGGTNIGGKTTLKRTTSNPDNPPLTIRTKTRAAITQSVSCAQFRKFAAAADLGGRVKLYMSGGEDPVKVEFQVGEEDLGYLAYFIAPQVAQ